MSMNGHGVPVDDRGERAPTRAADDPYQTLASGLLALTDVVQEQNTALHARLDANDVRDADFQSRVMVEFANLTSDTRATLKSVSNEVAGFAEDVTGQHNAIQNTRVDLDATKVTVTRLRALVAFRVSLIATVAIVTWEIAKWLGPIIGGLHP